MAGANSIFNDLFQTFQKNEFFKDAMYPFFWIEEISSSIDRETGDATVESNTYACDAFLVNPSKSERPQSGIFRDVQAGDIAILANQAELEKQPPLDTEVVFAGKKYTCKEIVQDPVQVTWKLLLRS